MNAISLPNVFTIPLGVPFALTLARSLWNEYQHDLIALSDVEIYLPNRRSCRSLAEAFLEVSEGRATLLPRLTPLGDIEDDDLLESDPFILDEDPHLRASIHPLERQILLAKLLLARKDLMLRPADAFSMARELASLIDRAHTESVDLKNIATLVTGDLAKHWKITAEFLEIITDQWPHILEAMQLADPAERRNVVLQKKAESLRRIRPSHRIIAAGSTGSIPATASLLDIISRLPNGCVILPGFDPSIDEATWQALDVQHPYHYQKRLLERMLIEPKHVKLWPHSDVPPLAIEKKNIALGALQPEESFDLTKVDVDKNVLENLTLIKAVSTAHEAKIVSMILRDVLNDPDKTAMVVTPDRDLAKKIQLEMRRWDVSIDDSGGESLDRKPIAVFLRLIAEIADSNTPATHALSLLRHEFMRLQKTQGNLNDDILSLENALRSSPLPPQGLSGFLQHNDMPLLHELLTVCTPLNTSETMTLSEWIKCHITIAETLAFDGIVPGSDILWKGDDGEAVAGLLQNFLALNEDASIVMDRFDYAVFFNTAIQQIILRPKQRMHPRLHILSPIEARLLNADVTILAGANEGVWPAKIEQDSWLSRPMRKDLGFSDNEARIGQSALDFLYLFCMPNTIVTWSDQREGSHALPSRWIQQIFAVMQKYDIAYQTEASEFFHWASQIDQPSSILPQKQPAPSPPLHARPTHLSVTQIDTWKNDPYAIYANKILKLRPAEALDRPLDVRDWGNAAHAILERFIGDGDYLHDDASKRFDHAVENVLASHPLTASQKMKWSTHLKNIKAWIISEARSSAKRPRVEVEKDIRIPIGSISFMLRGKADRIQDYKSGLMITDYKTGTTPRHSELKEGSSTQLPLLGYLFSQEGNVASLRYIKLEGKEDKPVTVSQFDDAKELIATGTDVLMKLLDAYYQQQIAYTAEPIPTDQFDRYRHLKRSSEWSAVIESNNDEVAS